ncbi:MAG: guanylate kinase [Chthoniobacter sp.]|jgi:guanylate kinase|nr:guanylate kinase [Chthoniobacter sp.]
MNTSKVERPELKARPAVHPDEFRLSNFDPPTPPPPRHGILFVISGPSGAGKTTLLEGLRRDQDFVYSTSCTTRPPRLGEIDGQDYCFLSDDEFQRRLDNSEFLEHAVVHGNYYGTSRETVMRNIERGIDVLIDVDIQGAAMIREHADGMLRNYIVDVFLTAPSLEILRRRLTKRATETPEALEIRMRNAAAEMQRWRDYRYTILSGTAQYDLESFRSIMHAERFASKRLILNLGQ